MSLCKACSLARLDSLSTRSSNRLPRSEPRTPVQPLVATKQRRVDVEWQHLASDKLVRPPCRQYLSKERGRPREGCVILYLNFIKQEFHENNFADKLRSLCRYSSLQIYVHGFSSFQFILRPNHQQCSRNFWLVLLILGSLHAEALCNRLYAGVSTCTKRKLA